MIGEVVEKKYGKAWKSHILRLVYRKGHQVKFHEFFKVNEC